VANGIDASENRVQSLRCHPAFNLPPGEPDRKQLDTGNDSVLPRRERCNHRVRPIISQFDTYLVFN